MSNITTVTVTIESITTIEVKVAWEINDEEFKEWAGHYPADSHPAALKDFLESSRYRDQEIRDHFLDHATEATKVTDTERKIASVSF